MCARENYRSLPKLTQFLTPAYNIVNINDNENFHIDEILPNQRSICDNWNWVTNEIEIFTHL